MTHWLENKRDALLCALYDNDRLQADHILGSIAAALPTRTCLDEHQQKTLSQILVMLKKFKPVTAKGNETGKIEMAARSIHRILAAHAKKKYRSPEIVSFDSLKAGLNLAECQWPLVLKTAITFQMTSGCSHFCRRCNEWALPGIRKHFSFDAAKTIIRQLAAVKNHSYTLYGASDPLDWEAEGKDIRDIMQFLEKNDINLVYGLLTKVPKGKKRLLKALVELDTDISVSITNKNRRRLEMLEMETGTIHRQHDFDDLLIAAGQDEDFISVKSSITDSYGTEITPDNVFIVIPTFTSALNPFGHRKIPVTRNTFFFPVRKTGRQALGVDYFKPLEVMTPAGKKIHLDDLLPTQVETLLLDSGTNELNPPGMTNIREFFDIFKPAAIKKRQQLLPSVIEKSSPAYISAFKDFCRPGPVLQSEVAAVSFFLRAVVQYALENRNRTTIISILCRNRINQSKRLFSQMPCLEDPARLFSDPETDAFKVFDYLRYHALTYPEHPAIQSFIHRFAARFDPLSDRYVLHDPAPC